MWLDRDRGMSSWLSKRATASGTPEARAAGAGTGSGTMSELDVVGAEGGLGEGGRVRLALRSMSDIEKSDFFFDRAMEGSVCCWKSANVASW